MTDRLKDFIARHVFHPPEGMTLGDWWSRKNRLDDLPEPLRFRIAHEWGRSFQEREYEP